MDIKRFFKRPEVEMVKWNGEIIGCRNINNEREVERGFLPLEGCLFNFHIVNSLLLNLHIL